jgi:hypothetical protein
LPDWCDEDDPPPGTGVAIQMPRRNGSDSDETEMTCLVFVTSVPLAGSEALASVTLPAHVDEGALHVFALALGD